MESAVRDRPGDNGRRLTKTERNNEITARFLAGEEPVAIARHYGITTQRCRRIAERGELLALRWEVTMLKLKLATQTVTTTADPEREMVESE